MLNMGFGAADLHNLQRQDFSKHSSFKYRNGTRVVVDPKSSYDFSRRPSSATLRRPSHAQAFERPATAQSAPRIPAAVRVGINPIVTLEYHLLNMILNLV